MRYVRLPWNYGWWPRPFNKEWRSVWWDRWSVIIIVVVVVVAAILYFHQSSQTNGFASTAASYSMANNELASELKAEIHKQNVLSAERHVQNTAQQQLILKEASAIEYLGDEIVSSNVTITALLQQHSTEFTTEQAELLSDQMRLAALESDLQQLCASAHLQCDAAP